MEETLKITLTQRADGKVGIAIEGPQSDTMTALLGLLEFAKHSIMSRGQPRQEPASPITLATMVPGMPNGRR
jgi:hypothetical protein